MKQPIIIGIDPGTTSAYAILNIDGLLIDKASAKELGLSELISRIIKHGLPIILGTDKSKIPDLIQQFAAKTGSKIAAPREDLRTEDKRKMTITHERIRVRYCHCTRHAW